MRWQHASGSSLGAEPRHRSRALRRLRRAGSGAVLLALLASHAPAQPAPANPAGDAPSGSSDESRRVAITVFGESDAMSTFADRVKSWFHDGTAVSVETATRSGARAAPVAEPGVVTVWVIVLTTEKALVTFSTRTESGAERHIVREVRLQNALDELGLERLASVIQSTVAALREGLEGSDLATLETELRGAGFELDAATPEPSAPRPVAPGPATGARPPTALVVETQEPETRREQEPRPSIDVGYGSRYGGEDALLHGPGVGFGWPFELDAGALWLVARAGTFFPTSVVSSPLRLSLHTSSARAGLAFEPRSHGDLSAYAAFLAGIDVVTIKPSAKAGARDDAEGYAVSGATTRIWGELGLLAGIWYRGTFDIGLFASLDYCTSDVHYVIESERGPDLRLLSPWRFQPGLSVIGRFGVTRRE